MTETNTVKRSKRINIEISTANYDKLCGIAEALQTIVKRNVSLDAALKVVLSPKLIDWSEILNDFRPNWKDDRTKKMVETAKQEAGED
jgi:hypothetical protein